MDLVVDANIIFAALIKDGLTTYILLGEKVTLYAPSFLIDEILKHESMLLQKSLRTPVEFKAILEVIKNIVHFVSPQVIEGALCDAIAISPDPDDAQYFAVALSLNIPIWSNDFALNAQDTIRIISTTELARLLLGQT